MILAMHHAIHTWNKLCTLLDRMQRMAYSYWEQTLYHITVVQ